MPLHDLLSVLNYGALGIAGIMLILAWRVLKAEQSRKAEPRQGIISLFKMFLLFCVVLVAVALWREFGSGAAENKRLSAEIIAFEGKLKESDGQKQALGHELFERTKQLDDLRQQFVTGDETRKKLSTEITLLQQQVSESHQRFKTLEVESAKARREAIVTFAEKEAEIDRLRTALAKIVQDVAQQMKQTAESYVAQTTVLYVYQSKVANGGAFVDRLTGATLGVSSISTALNSISGLVTFPDGKSSPFAVGDVGRGWSYNWNSRRFIIIIVAIEGRNSVTIAVRETTELPASEKMRDRPAS